MESGTPNLTAGGKKGCELVEERLTVLNIPQQTLANNQKVSAAHF